MYAARELMIQWKYIKLPVETAHDQETDAAWQQLGTGDRQASTRSAEDRPRDAAGNYHRRPDVDRLAGPRSEAAGAIRGGPRKDQSQVRPRPQEIGGMTDGAGLPHAGRG